LIVCTVHSAAAVVEVLDAELELVDEELEFVADELEVVSVVDDEVVPATVVVVEESDEVDELPTIVEVGKVGATATGLSPTWESARPTICHVKTVVSTRAKTQAAAMRQLIIN
jgi:hypothetical protein